MSSLPRFILILILSLLPCVLWLWYFYTRSIYKRDPLHLVALTFLLGGAATLVALPLNLLGQSLVYSSTISHWPSDEQLRLASLILEGVVETQAESAPEKQRQSVLDIIKDLPGGRIFKTAAEVDAYLREERDSWDR